MNSKEKLAQALIEEYNKIANSDYDIDFDGRVRFKIYEMSDKAKEGYYSDYDSPLVTPCIQLVKDLESLGLNELADRARNGEFEATEEESNAWYEREGRAIALEVTGGNEEIADALFGKLSKEETEAKEGIKGWDI